MGTRLRIGAVALATACLASSLAIGHAPALAEADAPGSCVAIDDAAAAALADAIHDGPLDAAAAGAVMEDNVVYTSPTHGVVTGRDAVVDALGDLQTSFTGLTLEPAEVMVDSPYIIVRYTMAGTHDGAYSGLDASGKEVAASAISVYRLHCGMIGEVWTHFDNLGLHGQISDDYAAFAPSEALPAPVMPESCAEPTREDMETLVREMYTEAWTRQPNLDSVLAENVVLHSALGPDITGLDKVEPLRANYFTAFPDLEYRHGELIVDGDLAATWWTATGTDEGGFLGEEPTGETMILDGITIYRGECGKIAEIWTESDLAGVLDQLGTDGIK
jgi:predicted ester cyclase